jgi:hypothetical protein
MFMYPVVLLFFQSPEESLSFSNRHPPKYVNSLSRVAVRGNEGGFVYFSQPLPLKVHNE